MYNISALNNYLFSFCESWQETAFLKLNSRSVDEYVYALCILLEI